MQDTGSPKRSRGEGVHIEAWQAGWSDSRESEATIGALLYSEVIEYVDVRGIGTIQCDGPRAK